MWKNIISQGILQIIILGAILFKGNLLYYYIGPEMFGVQSSIGVKHGAWNG